LRSSGVLQRFRSAAVERYETVYVLIGLISLVVAFANWCYRNGFILYYGDAQAHLNISRSIIDSRTPGYDQIGTVWLPLLHWMCLPLVRVDSLWSNGLAGTIPVSICFVVAGTCFYLAAKEVYQSSVAAVVVITCLALNPNILYLAVIPMTEIVFLAGLAVLVLALVRFRRTPSPKYVALAVAGSWWMSLTRYDGWFLIPFAALYFAWFAHTRKVTVFLLFGLFAALAPAYWMAHNWWETSNALDFYNGPYAPAAIQGANDYPGYHNWRQAAQYYVAAGRLCTGPILWLLGGFGIFCAVKTRHFAFIALLSLLPAFYIWSVHSSKLPIHVPVLWPFTFYNTRYGLALMPLSAFAAGAITCILPAGSRKWSILLPLFAACPWLFHPSRENWICWKESQVNQVARSAWADEGAKFLRAYYTLGEGIIAGFGDKTGILCRAKIPIAENLHEGNGPEWLATISRPDLIHGQIWAIAQAGDSLSRSFSRTTACPYQLFETIQVPNAPALEIYRRDSTAAIRTEGTHE
jgi:hypothetical protein